MNAISTMDWQEVIHSVEASRKLLTSLWEMDSQAVAEGIDRAHREISILEYNDENSLSCAIGLAYYSARRDYRLIRELPSGRGFADVVFLPLSQVNKPALVIELKYDKTANAAIQQIKDRQYPQSPT